METTSKYLQFALNTFFKMSKKRIQISSNVYFLNIPGFFSLYMGSPSKMPLSISSGPSFYIGIGFHVSKYSIPGPFSLRFCHYVCNQFSPSSCLVHESAMIESIARPQKYWTVAGPHKNVKGATTIEGYKSDGTTALT